MSPLSIVIITFNEEKRIAHLLQDLCTQNFRNFEVILVDSNSSDRTCKIAETFTCKLPKLTIHRMRQRGASMGRNVGASLAVNERLLFLDADVRLKHTFLAQAMRSLDKSGLEIAGVYMGANGLPFGYKLGYALFNIGFFVTQFCFPTAVGACIFSTRHAHQRLGGFDEQIILCEDCDYVRRAGRTWRFRFLPLTFSFDPRRLRQDGFFHMGCTYLRANLRRFFCGEMRKGEIEYKFGHYS